MAENEEILLPFRNKWRLDSLDEWREKIEARLEKFDQDTKTNIDRLERKIGEMSNAQLIAEEVAARLEQRRRFSLSIRSKIGLGALALIPPVFSALLTKLF